MGVKMSKLKKPKKIKDPMVNMRGKIISALRRLTFTWEPINNKYKKAKVAPSTYQCELCDKWCYNGKSSSAVSNLRETYPNENIQHESVYRDHKEPIFEIKTDYVFSWDTIIERMFCEESNISILCFSCHKKKTDNENILRKSLRKSNKEEL